MASPVQPNPDIIENQSPGNENTDNQSLAFTIEFSDHKVDDTKKLKIHERLSSSFLTKHRRNPSLPDYTASNPHKSNMPMKLVDKEVVETKIKKPVNKSNTSPVATSAQHINGRRSSLNDIDNCQKKLNETYTATDKDLDDVSDTVSEAGTYTVDKEDTPQAEADNDNDSSDFANVSFGSTNINPNHKWINDWVCKVAEQNFQYVEEPPIIPSKCEDSGSSSASASKIPSPINTLPNKFKYKASKLSEAKSKPLEEKSFVTKFNGSLHRRSSSLSAKDYADNRGNDKLDTEQFLKTTESVVTAMQNRMRLSLDPRDMCPKKDGRNHAVEKPHPPSTASDTDTNSDTDGRAGFKKPSGAPFTSARLNRAFSLRRAKAEPETESKRSGTSGKEENRPTTPHELRRGGASARSTPSPNPVKTKPPMTSPFARTDCGRFSMRSTASVPKTSTFSSTPAARKDVKKAGTSNGRSNSSLSSKETEFQNWKRRKSFDPMKAAAEGRKKEMAKKAAMIQPMGMTQSMTQSSSLSTAVRMRNGNPVLRSASFHSTPHGAANLEADDDQVSVEEYEDSPSSSWVSNQPVLPPNSPSRGSMTKPSSLLLRAPVGGSRCSLNSGISETHSSPSHRVRSEVLDNLVMSAIHDLSFKLKIKSCHLLKKLNSLYDADEERSDRLRDEIAILESRRSSGSGSPSRDLSTTLKNLKSLENVLSVLDDVLFDESLQVCIDN